MNLLNLTPEEFCKATAACDEGHEFSVQYKTMAEVWDNCPRSDWLLWIVNELGQMPDDRTLRLFAVWCARHTPLGDGRVTGDLLADPRSFAALEVAERHAHGQATDAELTAADFNVPPATLVTDTTLAAAAAAAAVSLGARTSVARASAIAIGAVRSSARKRSTALVTYTACEAARRAQADQFRRMVANPFRA